MAILNCAVPFSQQSGKTKSYLKFLDQLINDILLHHSRGERRQAFTGRQQSMLQLLERHFPAKIPSTAKRSNLTRQCHICFFETDDDGRKLRRESRYFVWTEMLLHAFVNFIVSNPAASSQEDVHASSSESEAEDM